MGVAARRVAEKFGVGVIMTTTNTPERATERLIDRVDALDAIPGNWCDPMLTGPNAVLPKDQSYKPKEIERLLNAVRQRIEALPAVNTHDALQAENERLREQVKALRAGLVPFAKAADIKLCGDWMDDESIARTDISHHIKFGHLRRARALLTPQEPNNG